jgi:hypothetical protein
MYAQNTITSHYKYWGSCMEMLSTEIPVTQGLGSARVPPVEASNENTDSCWLNEVM